MHKVIPIIHVLPKLGLLFLMLLLMPMLMSYFFLNGAFPAFAYTASVTTIGSCTAWVLALRFSHELHPCDGFTLVLMLWLAFAAVVAMPIYFHMPNMSFTDAFLEAMSGLAMTGSTAMNSLDTLAPSVNFWRHILNWLGGMGIIVSAVAILPMLGVGGMQPFKAEIPGMDKENKMALRISQVAKELQFSYILTTVAAFASPHLVGMSWFDALCHAMSVVALGGFSTHNGNVAYSNSASTKWVLIFFIVFGAANFVSHFVAFVNRSLKVYWCDEECRVLLSILSGSAVVSTAYLWYMEYYPSLVDSIRFTAFNFVSVGPANGFSNVDFAKWPLMISLWTFLLPNVLASSGSMGSGIKNVRGSVMFKLSTREMMILLHFRAVRTAKVNGHSIRERMALAVMSLTPIYFMMVVISSFLMMVAGLDFLSTFTAVITCITNAGPGSETVGPEHNHAVLSDARKWSCAMVVLLGRLETFIALISFTPAYRKR